MGAGLIEHPPEQPSTGGVAEVEADSEDWLTKVALILVIVGVVIALAVALSTTGKGNQ